MSQSTPPKPRVTIPELVERLEALGRGEPCNLAFDGDGTLWSGDVSDDVFLTACDEDWFAEPVRAALEALLHTHNISTAGTLGEQARRLFLAEKSGLVEERLLFEFMTWCYAGRNYDELSAYAETVLVRRRIDERIRHSYRTLFEWARHRGHPCWLVTASPWPIVRVASKRLGLDEALLIAARPAMTESGVITTGMAGPVPYREQKPLLLKTRCKLPRILAAFGDSPFDIELLKAAELAVAVAPKPALLAQLGALDPGVILDFQPEAATHQGSEL